MSPVNGTDNDWISGIGYSSWEMYERWPTIDGLLDSYLTTGDRSYLEYALAAGEEFIANEKPEGWYSENSESYGHGMAEWRAGAAIGRTISIILNDDKVLYKLTPIISLRAEKLREKLVTRIWDKWKGVGGLNTNVTHFIGRIGVMGLGLKNTHKLVNPGTPNPYTGELTRLANDLNNSLLANINGESQNILCRISNPQNCGVDYNYTIDVSHAGDTVNFIVEAYLAGVVFDKETIWRLINTVKTVIKHQTELKFNDLVNGQGGFGVRGMQQGGWIKLARFDPELRQLYKDWAINPNNLPPSKYTVLHILGNLGRAINKK